MLFSGVASAFMFVSLGMYEMSSMTTTCPPMVNTVAVSTTINPVTTPHSSW